METIHTHDSPIAAYLEGEGSYEPGAEDSRDEQTGYISAPESNDHPINEQPSSFAPSSEAVPQPRIRIPEARPLGSPAPSPSAIDRVQQICSLAWKSRPGRTDNRHFVEHFRYTIVASQLLNEYLDHGALAPGTELGSIHSLDGAADGTGSSTTTVSIYGVVGAAISALVFAYGISWTRTRHGGTFWTSGRTALALGVLVAIAFVEYHRSKRKWIDLVRQQSVDAVSSLTTNWQTFELSSSSALAFIQEVELVSKGYRLSTPLPPASRIEDSGPGRRCAKLRSTMHRAYSSVIPACATACELLRQLTDVDDLEKYYEVYDISSQDAREAFGPASLTVLEDDPESLKSLRVLSFRAGIIRRVTLCSLMALGGERRKPDMTRWQAAATVMRDLDRAIATSAESIRRQLSEMEQFSVPTTPIKASHKPAREKMRGQVRKISALSSGIRGLQAKMQILREETNRSIEQSEDLTDLGATLMAQYESIGSDLRELMQAWEIGKQSLQSNITRQEHRISMASSNGLRSPVSSLGGLTAVEESDGSPSDALRVLTGGDGGGSKSDRSSIANSTSEEETAVFEAFAKPRQRASTLTRQERIVRMHEERERQAALRSKRDANTSMLRELESVISLRPKKTLDGGARVTSL